MASIICCHQCGSVNSSANLCSKCKQRFCSSCVIPNPNDSTQLLCKHDHKSLIDTLDLALKEELGWNTINSRGHYWMQKSGAEDLREASDKTFLFYLSLNLEENDRVQIEKDIFAGRTDAYTFNHDLSELFSKVITDEMRTRVSRVLTGFCARNPQIGYCQGMNTIAAWLLLFLDEESAFWLLCRLVESVLLPDFYGGGKRGNSLNGFYIEASVIAALLGHYLPELSTISLSVSEFSDMFSIQLLIQLFVNVLQIPSTIFLWDRLTSEGVKVK